MIPWSSMDTKDTIEKNVQKALGNISNLLDVIISLFSVDSEGTGVGDDSIKDSLVFHRVPKDTMEENVGVQGYRGYN